MDSRLVKRTMKSTQNNSALSSSLSCALHIPVSQFTCQSVDHQGLWDLLRLYNHSLFSNSIEETWPIARTFFNHSSLLWLVFFAAVQCVGAVCRQPIKPVFFISSKVNQVRRIIIMIIETVVSAQKQRAITIRQMKVFFTISSLPICMRFQDYNN